MPTTDHRSGPGRHNELAIAFACVAALVWTSRAGAQGAPAAPPAADRPALGAPGAVTDAGDAAGGAEADDVAVVPSTPQAEPLGETVQTDASVVRPLPEWRLAYRTMVAGRYNAIGGSFDSRITLRRLLYRSDALAWRQNFIGLSVAPNISPAYARVGVGLDVQPASFLTLWANFEANAFFGTFNVLQSYPSAADNYGDSVARVLGALPVGDARRPYRTVGTQWNMGADLAVRVGPIGARNQTRVSRPQLSLRPGDRVFYEQHTDQLVPNNGWYLNNDLDVAWFSDFGLFAGVRGNIAQAFFAAGHVQTAAELQVAQGTQARAGPVIGYTFFENEGAIVDKPTVVLITNWWIVHRFRAGAESSQALPMVALAFTMQGDLLPWR